MIYNNFLDYIGSRPDEFGIVRRFVHTGIRRLTHVPHIDLNGGILLSEFIPVPYNVSRVTPNSISANVCIPLMSLIYCIQS